MNTLVRFIKHYGLLILAAVLVASGLAIIGNGVANASTNHIPHARAAQYYNMANYGIGYAFYDSSNLWRLADADKATGVTWVCVNTCATIEIEDVATGGYMEVNGNGQIDNTGNTGLAREKWSDIACNGEGGTSYYELENVYTATFLTGTTVGNNLYLANGFCTNNQIWTFAGPYGS